MEWDCQKRSVWGGGATGVSPKRVNTTSDVSIWQLFSFLNCPWFLCFSFRFFSFCEINSITAAHFLDISHWRHKESSDPLRQGKQRTHLKLKSSIFYLLAFYFFFLFIRQRGRGTQNWPCQLIISFFLE